MTKSLKSLKGNVRRREQYVLVSVWCVQNQMRDAESYSKDVIEEPVSARLTNTHTPVCGVDDM